MEWPVLCVDVPINSAMDMFDYVKQESQQAALSDSESLQEAQELIGRAVQLANLLSRLIEEATEHEESIVRLPLALLTESGILADSSWPRHIVSEDGTARPIG